ncbi:hypothetical protein JTB14_001217 [Gonioctena quinquepunctata]|nr:hypothetical protein JTB14_001217 [Gonioctena quinquepunctata]
MALIKIQSPGDDAEVYRNRKGYFSINTQVICDASLRFLDVVGRWPGSIHDNTIFNNCRIRRKFEQGSFPNCVLLGESGKPSTPQLVSEHSPEIKN